MSEIYKQKCKYCGKEFKSLYPNQVTNNLEIHEKYCKDGQK
jgi:hypothetical protein